MALEGASENLKRVISRSVQDADATKEPGRGRAADVGEHKVQLLPAAPTKPHRLTSPRAVGDHLSQCVEVHDSN